MTLLSALSEMEQMEGKRAFIHHGPITACRLPSLPGFSFTITKLLLCKTADVKTTHIGTHALHEQVLYYNNFCASA